MVNAYAMWDLSSDAKDLYVEVKTYESFSSLLMAVKLKHVAWFY
jgi:hypothetical protein